MVQLPSKTNIKELIIALTLGDGYMRIQQNAKHAYLEISHSINQENYLIFKANVLNNFGDFPFKITKRIIEINNKKYPVSKITFNSKSEFTQMYRVIYKDGIKSLSSSLKYFDETALAFLFMDDGSAKIKKRVKRKDGKVLYSETGYIEAFMIATNCFTFEECYDFSNFLYKKFGITATVQKDRDRPRIAISNSHSKKILLSIVKPFIDLVPELEYKVNKPLSMSEANFI